MIIKIKGKCDLNFESYEVFFEYIKDNIINNLISDDGKLLTFYENNEIYNGIKKFKYDINRLYYNKTTHNIDYWLTRGWSLEHAIANIKEAQTKNSILSKNKMKLLKDSDYYKWCSTMNTKKEFYLTRGYSEIESIKLLKNRQATFSLEKCIKKYSDAGYEIWNNRQILWKNKMSNIEFNTDSNSVDFYMKKYGKNWIKHAIDGTCFNRKEFLLDIIKISNNDFDIFIDEYNKRDEIYTIGDIAYIYSSVIFQSFFNLTKNQLQEIVLDKFNINKTSFGVIRYFNGHICRSNGEYYIAKKLMKHNIDYVYEKKYPNSKMICDFYIPIFDLYVEYTGLASVK